MELGVYQGGSASVLYQIAKNQQRDLFLFDTFKGIPFKAEIDHHKVGDFSDVDFESIRVHMPDAYIVMGIFPESFMETGPIAFCHIDADQYASVKSGIEMFSPRMVPGGVMLFDDYMKLEGATVAVQESMGIIEENWVRF